MHHINVLIQIINGYHIKEIVDLKSHASKLKVMIKKNKEQQITY